MHCECHCPLLTFIQTTVGHRDRTYNSRKDAHQQLPVEPKNAARQLGRPIQIVRSWMTILHFKFQRYAFSVVNGKVKCKQKSAVQIRLSFSVDSPQREAGKANITK